jgi:hypothetical protein
MHINPARRKVSPFKILDFFIVTTTQPFANLDNIPTPDADVQLFIAIVFATDRGNILQ